MLMMRVRWSGPFFSPSRPSRNMWLTCTLVREVRCINRGRRSELSVACGPRTQFTFSLAHILTLPRSTLAYVLPSLLFCTFTRVSVSFDSFRYFEFASVVARLFVSFSACIHVSYGCVCLIFFYLAFPAPLPSSKAGPNICQEPVPTRDCVLCAGRRQGSAERLFADLPPSPERR